MKLSKINTKEQSGVSTSVISRFGGYDHNHIAAEGTFFDMKNMTSDYYPLLCPRDKRGYIRTLTKCNGISATDKLFWADNYKFYYDGSYVCDLIETDDKQFVQMGAYICIFPDNIAYNTYTDEVIPLENSFISETNPVLSLCKMDGTVYDSEHLWIGEKAPADKNTYIYWLDLSTQPAVLKLWSDNESQWVSVPTCYIKIECEGIGEGFKEEDAVTISGCDIEDFNGSMIVKAKGDDYLVVIGFMDEGVHTNSTPMSFERTVPQMDFVCELNNRLWGCSSVNHEIYASKQGDPTNWNYFGGISSDSFAATVGTFGEFTGCIAHLGYVLFFKQNGVHKVYGNMPSNYQISWTELRGVQKGSEKSLVVLNEVLFYKSVEGICVYDGSLPVNISSELGVGKYYDAVAGHYKEKYYVSMRDEQYQYSLFVYDTKTKLWHREDSTMIYGFGVYDGQCYIVNQLQEMWVFPYNAMESYMFPAMTDDEGEYNYPNPELYAGVQVKGEYEEDFDWYAETNDMGLDNPYEKYVSNLTVRMMLEDEAEIRILIQYDSCGVWDELFNTLNGNKRTFSVPLRVQRCDHYKLRFEGKGVTKIYSIMKKIENGSEYEKL